ncbi:MAG: HPr family phosphocarrier protein [Candidatus Borkfalkiaceae bacterium]|nr:HPr family phosphocarrier protein [Christensenellaceae bacterium]
MKSIQISLQMANQVKKFVSIVQNYSFEIDLRSDRYVVDAKSILGIFSLDLSKPINVEIHAADKDKAECDKLLEELKQFAA